MGNLEVRALRTLREFRECERIQEEVWGGAGAAGETLSVAAKYGGAVLGAFGGGKLAGFLFAFLARRRGRVMHWSHMMAVRRRFRDRGLGFKMKLAHRKFALAQRIKSICWTFDPLQSRNAALNIAHLGATVEEYMPDCYGRFPSSIERGLASDRFVVNWKIASRAVERRLRGSAPSLDLTGLPRANETTINSEGLLVNRRIHLRLSAPELLVEIPANTDAMRSANIKLAARWRMESRRIFQNYFQAGYRVTDFIPPSAATEGKCFYMLRRTRGGL